MTVVFDNKDAPFAGLMCEGPIKVGAQLQASLMLLCGCCKILFLLEFHVAAVL